jgi:hypothetical protein
MAAATSRPPCWTARPTEWTASSPVRWYGGWYGAYHGPSRVGPGRGQFVLRVMVGARGFEPPTS